jgi:hypothetical protein
MQNVAMDNTPHQTNYFIVGLLNGLAAPVGLYPVTAQYPYFLAAPSVPQSFAQVGSFMSYALSRYRDDVGRSTAERQ